MAAAEGRTGLDDWGDPAFRERLDVLCAALTRAGRPVARRHRDDVRQLVRQLSSTGCRWRRSSAPHPEIHDVAIERPIIICGLPRTGTTHLHNLIAADPALRSLPYWESLEPVPAPVRGRRRARPAGDRCAAGLEIVNTAMPEFKRMHEMTVDHVHEEIQLLAIDFSGMLFETMRLMPDMAPTTTRPTTRRRRTYLKRVLQALQWLRGGARWVLKSPQHLEQFPVAVDDVPRRHLRRHPPRSRRGHRVDGDDDQPTRPGWHATTRIPRGSAATGSTASRPAQRLPARPRRATRRHSRIDVRFDDFMADEDGTVAAIYALAGQPYDERARAAMAQFCVEHPRGRHGGVDVRTEDLGLDVPEVESRFSAYRERFVS